MDALVDVSLEQQAKQAASEIQHKYGSAPIDDLFAYVESVVDADIAVINADEGEHGLTVKDHETDRIYIAIPTTPDYMRWRSNLAHELAHAYFEDWRQEIESEPLNHQSSGVWAEAFVRHLLVPEHVLKKDYGGAPVTESILSDIVRRFGVSPQMAGTALKQAGLVSDNQYSRWNFSTVRLAYRHGWGESYRQWSRMSQAERPPRRLLERALSGYAAGVFSAAEIAAIKNQDIASVKRDLEIAFPTAGREVVEDSQAFPAPSEEFLEGVQDL